jgi:DNA-binding response OmpR family regulator
MDKDINKEIIAISHNFESDNCTSETFKSNIVNSILIKIVSNNDEKHKSNKIEINQREHKITIGAYVIDLTAEEYVIDLTTGEYDLLMYLFDNYGEESLK